LDLAEELRGLSRFVGRAELMAIRVDFSSALCGKQGTAAMRLGFELRRCGVGWVVSRWLM